LPDGTIVWLNAASSLKFPTSFAGSKRQVELTGEAYFEVTENKSMPFEVLTGETSVSVLGTHFNINAYADEASINTTLLEGAVKVHTGQAAKLLKPGQQSVFVNATGALSIQPADVDQAIAWKRGFFEFDNTDLQTIMRQISRWYDVDIVYQIQGSKALFGGGISRKLNLSEVLHLLEASGVYFKVENRKVTVLNNTN
jgi:transmembrane sensor